jgi:hypothetical protein
MNIYKIKTTSYEEEDFYLLTNLSESQIEKAITPIVKAERHNPDAEECFYDNDMLVEAIKEKYPSATVEMYQEFDTITI